MGIMKKQDNLMIVSLDDTDSNEGMCTTYLASNIINHVENLKLGSLSGDPYLIRLNPTIPHKTRGNAAVCIIFELNSESSISFSEKYDKIMSLVKQMISENSKIDSEKTNPGAVFIPGSRFYELKSTLGAFYEKAQKSVLEIPDAFDLIEKHSIDYFYMKLGRGLIGSLAAAGVALNGLSDKTYELLAYRKLENLKTERKFDAESFFVADKNTYPHTWDTVDYFGKLKKQIVCVPGSPDPVLFGIRGKSADWVLNALKYIKSEPFDHFRIFVTNQGTDMHLIDAKEISELKDLHSYRISGIVNSIPKTIEGGHVFFELVDNFSENSQIFDKIDCAAYEPTGSFRQTIRKLIPGDEIVVFGSFKDKTINIEKIDILKLKQNETVKNPTCPVCLKTMESAGKNQGFRCKLCKTKSPEKVKETIQREIEKGIYEVPPSARRHLSKPLIRDCQNEKSDVSDFSSKKIHPSR